MIEEAFNEYMQNKEDPSKYKQNTKENAWYNNLFDKFKSSVKEQPVTLLQQQDKLGVSWKLSEAGKMYQEFKNAHDKKKDELAPLELKIDKMLEQLYKQATTAEYHSQIASQDFLIQLRRVSDGRSFETEIEELKDKPAVADILYDNILQNYFDAFLTKNIEDAIKELGSFQDQLNYMSASQVVLLNRFFIEAYDKVKASHQKNNMEMPYDLYGALFEPFILTFDLTKFYGENISEQFFKDMYGSYSLNYDKASILAGQGVWLFDNKTASLKKVQICKKYCIYYFGLFLETIPDFIGSKCSLADNIEFGGCMAMPKGGGGEKESGKTATKAPDLPSLGVGKDLIAGACFSYLASFAGGGMTCSSPDSLVDGTSGKDPMAENPKTYVEAPSCPLKFMGEASGPRPGEEDTPGKAKRGIDTKDNKQPKDNKQKKEDSKTELKHAQEYAQEMMNKDFQEKLDSVTKELTGLSVKPSAFLPTIEEQNAQDKDLSEEKAPPGYGVFGTYNTSTGETTVDVTAHGSDIFAIAKTLVHEAIHKALLDAGVPKNQHEEILKAMGFMCNPNDDSCSSTKCTAGQEQAIKMGFTECSTVAAPQETVGKMSLPPNAGVSQPSAAQGGLESAMDCACFGACGNDDLECSLMDCAEGYVATKQKNGQCKCEKGAPGGKGGFDKNKMPGPLVTDPSPEPAGGTEPAPKPSPGECEPKCKPKCPTHLQCVVQKTTLGGCESSCSEGGPSPKPFEDAKMGTQENLKQPVQQNWQTKQKEGQVQIKEEQTEKKGIK